MNSIGGSGITVGNSSRKAHCRIYIRSYFLNILTVVLLSAGLSGIGVMLSDVFDIYNIERYVRTPVLFALNALPLALLMLLLYHISSRLWFSFGIGGGLFLALEIVNRFKMYLREEPLTIQDLLLGTEALKVVRLSELPFGCLEILSGIIWASFSILLFVYVKSEKLRWPQKTFGAIFSVVLFCLPFNSLYKDIKLYDSFKVQGSIYSRVNQFRSHGFIYAFLYTAKNPTAVKPEGYSKAEAKKILDGYHNVPESENAVKPPHIIAVMGEAFYDIDRISGIEFNEGYDPLANFNRIKKQAYSGRIVTNVFGGGTANTEFAFLTGHSLAIMPGLESPYTSYLRKDTFSLARVLKEAGYSTLAFHPGDSWFYNRGNVYNFFGFDSIFFKKDMDVENIKTVLGYVSDMDSAKFTVEKLATHLSEKPDIPYFEFMVNIQNHGPYSKEGIGYPKILKQTASMNSSSYNILNNYINGLSGCDTALGYLADSLEEMDEPIVLLYFADHLPYLGYKNAGYAALGFSISQSGDLEAFLNQYETPWFLWYNKAARKQLSDRGEPVPTGTAPEISANFLATVLLKTVGLNGGEYFNYLSELEKTIPVITNRFSKVEGVYTEKISDKAKQSLDQYRELQYYMLMEKEAVTP
jgi:phosphoglycerol transferase MdoB-like AlkP superfamily enzyme